MNVKLVETGKTAKMSASYALRLIEQGKAIPAPPSVSGRKTAKKEPTTPTKGGEANGSEG